MLKCAHRASPPALDDHEQLVRVLALGLLQSGVGKHDIRLPASAAPTAQPAATVAHPSAVGPVIVAANAPVVPPPHDWDPRIQSIQLCLALGTHTTPRYLHTEYLYRIFLGPRCCPRP